MPMATWELWLELARESFETGWTCGQANRFRSAVARFYFAAYQAATAILLYRKQIPPVGREAWSHEITPDMLMQHLGEQVSRQEDRRRLSNHLRDLRDARIISDYVATQSVTAADGLQARESAEEILRIAASITRG
jgi:uncharacterized protein (UPF0332 family)